MLSTKCVFNHYNYKKIAYLNFKLLCECIVESIVELIEKLLSSKKYMYHVFLTVFRRVKKRKKDVLSVPFFCEKKYGGLKSVYYVYVYNILLLPMGATFFMKEILILKQKS